MRTTLQARRKLAPQLVFVYKTRTSKTTHHIHQSPIEQVPVEQCPVIVVFFKIHTGIYLPSLKAGVTLMVMGTCQTRQPINHRMLLLATIIMAEVQKATSLICSKLAINQGPTLAISRRHWQAHYSSSVKQLGLLMYFNHESVQKANMAHI